MPALRSSSVAAASRSANRWRSSIARACGASPPAASACANSPLSPPNVPPTASARFSPPATPRAPAPRAAPAPPASRRPSPSGAGPCRCPRAHELARPRGAGARPARDHARPVGIGGDASLSLSATAASLLLRRARSAALLAPAAARTRVSAPRAARSSRGAAPSRRGPTSDRRAGRRLGGQHALVQAPSAKSEKRAVCENTPRSTPCSRRARQSRALPTMAPKLVPPEQDEIPITSAEERELIRVHRLLCDYHSKRKVLRELRPRQDRVTSLRSRLDDEDGAPRGRLRAAAARRRDPQLRDKIQAGISRTARSSHRSRRGAAHAGSAARSSIQDDLGGRREPDECIDWDEMRIMFQPTFRQVSLEPKLYNLSSS